MKHFLTKEQRAELKDIIEFLGKSLDITKTQFDNLTKSYTAVGEFLENDPTFALYRPIVTPQGSLRLGTIIQPINVDDDLDVDLVYRLSDKKAAWTQKDLKDMVGARLKGSERYSPMLKEEEGRRCWTLLYRDNSDSPKEKYHMDILPSVADSKFNERLILLFSECFSISTVDQLSIRITDKKDINYDTSTRIECWLKSNPDGYALWFANRCKADESVRLNAEAIVPISGYNKDKTVLQRIVQILKRHRDVMFQDDKENKPISIIITTLAARVYDGESDLLDGLIKVVQKLEHGIEKRQNGEDWVVNPVNPEENFADKWSVYPERRENFYDWMEAIKRDVTEIISSVSSVTILKTIGRAFGKETAKDVASQLTEHRKSQLATGATRLSKTGIVGANEEGRIINTANTFYGK